MNLVKLVDIVFDAGTQIRASINEDVVSQYAERMAAGDVFPAVVLFHDGNRYYIADGFHRSLAAQRNGLHEIPAEVQPGTKTDALWFALGANKANGQRLTTADKKHAIVLALQTWPDRSATMIAEQIGCSQQHVQHVKAGVTSACNLPSRVTGKDGKSYPASRVRTTEHPRRDQIEAGIIAGEKAVAIAKSVGVSSSVVAATRKAMGLSDSVDKSRTAVAQRREDVRSMAERGFSTRQIASALGVHEATVSDIAKTEGIHIHADRAIGKTQRHDANRIVGQMALDAENLTADVNLIEFSDLDRAQLSTWIAQFESARKSLSSLIRRLQKEQHTHEVEEHAEAV